MQLLRDIAKIFTVVNRFIKNKQQLYFYAMRYNDNIFWSFANNNIYASYAIYWHTIYCIRVI